jgi:uncharacterized protein with HEPN domain
MPSCYEGGPPIRLLDALEQIELIQTFAERVEKLFSEVLLQSAILHRLTRLGEACRALSPQLRAAHEEILWTQIIAFRNVLIHEHFGIDLDLVWVIISDHIGPLRSALAIMLEAAPD